MMKKILSAVIAIVMALSSVSAFAIDYGTEWDKYSSELTNTFTDVPKDHWACDEIDRVVAKGWFDGYPDGSFHPGGKITRAEALKVFVKFLGLSIKTTETSSYHDVNKDAWYSPYVEAGKKLFPEIKNFNGEIPFLPEQNITRETTIYALVTAKKYTDETTFADQSILNMFSDQNSISELIKPYAAVAVDLGLVSGYDDGTIGAQDPLTRAEFAAMLYRATFIGDGTSILKLEEENPTINEVIVNPATPVQLAIGETYTISAMARMSDGTNVDYTANCNPMSSNNCIRIDGKVVTAVSPGTAVVSFLNDPNLASKNATFIVTQPNGTPVFSDVQFPSSTTNATAKIEGKVSDPTNATLSLDIDGETVSIRNNKFSVNVDLDEGQNVFTLTLKNQYGAMAVKTVKIKRIVEEPPTPSPTTTPTARPVTNPDPDPTVTPEPTITPEPVDEITSFELSQVDEEISVNETVRVTLYAVYRSGRRVDCTSEYTLVSSDPNVLTVDRNGTVRAISRGTATISMSRSTLPVAGESSIRIFPPVEITVESDSTELVALEWSESSVELKVGETKTVKLYGVYSDGSKIDMTEECEVQPLKSCVSMSGTTVKGEAVGNTQLWYAKVPREDIELPATLSVKVTE